MRAVGMLHPSGASHTCAPDEDQQDLVTETDLDHSQCGPRPTGPLDCGTGRPVHGHWDYSVHICPLSHLSGTGATLLFLQSTHLANGQNHKVLFCL